MTTAKMLLLLLNKAIAGGLAGQVSWAFCFPVDVVKTYMQDANSYNSMSDTIYHIYKTQGIKRIYKGIGPCLMGAFPTSAVLVAVYDYLLTF